MSSTTGDFKIGPMLLVKDRTIAGLNSLWILGTFITGLFSSKGKAEDFWRHCAAEQDISKDNTDHSVKPSSTYIIFSCASNVHVHFWNKGVLMLTDEWGPWVILTHPTIPVSPGQFLFEWQYMGISSNHWILMRFLFIGAEKSLLWMCFGLGIFRSLWRS